MERTRAITLKSTDIGDNDKLLTLYSLEHGRVTVTARGIRKSTAKLKFAKELFCFGSFELVDKGGRYILASCTQMESFANIRADIISYYAGCAIVDVVLALEQEGQANSRLFVTMLQALSQLERGTDSSMVLAKFLLAYLDCSGYALSFNQCHMCGNTNAQYLDVELGGVVCDKCRTPNSMAMMGGSMTLMRYLTNMPFDKLNTINAGTGQLDQVLFVLNAYIAHSLGKVKCLTAYIALPK